MSEATATNNQDVTQQNVGASVVEEPKKRSDKYIWGIYIVLCAISIIELYSASSREVAAAGVYGPIIRHCMMLGMGAILTIGISRVPYKWFMPLAPIVALVGVGLMVYVMLFGEIINGARRSFELWGIAIQPAEIIKLASVLMVALIMSRNQMRQGVKTKGVFWAALLVVIFGGLLFPQGLTNFILLMSISCSMMLIGGVQMRKMLVVFLCYLLLGGGALAYKVYDDIAPQSTQQTEVVEEKAADDRSATWMARLDRYFGDSIPKYEKPITAENRQEMYSYMAQANGGVIGVFPGNSRETARLPLAFSDYIFAIVIEDVGLVGGIVLLIIYLALLLRAGNIASQCSRAFPALLVMGMAVMICLQALFHMGITTGVLPVSGQPLPLISKGGTSIIITSVAFGIMLSVSRYAVTSGKKQEIKQELNVLPEALHADNPTQL